MTPNTRLAFTQTQLLGVIALRLPAITARLQADADEIDGYPTATLADGPAGGGRTVTVNGERIPVTSVEAAVIARAGETGRTPHTRASDALWRLGELLGVLTWVTNELDAWQRQNGGEPVTDTVKRRLTCTGNGTKVCHHIADPLRADGLCLEHGKEADDRKRDRAQRDRQRYHADRRAG